MFAVAQQIGKALFLPIAILPFAGILLGIGSSFTNQTTIATYGLSNIIYPGSLLYSILLLLNDAGGAVFVNLPLIFALAVALGMAKKEKGVAVISAGIFYLIMITVISTMLKLDGSIVDGVISEKVKAGAIASVLGIQTLQMGVFAGVVVGVITALLCNRFYKMELPASLSFFSGTRFVPIVSILAAVITGVVLYYVWPIIQNGIFSLGELVRISGYFGTFLYGLIERSLIPFGLHHIFYMPFWQTSLGGTATIDGVTVMGAQNIFFAELASPNTVKFSVDACRFLTGKYPFMMGGLPGAALAMYRCARPEKRKVAGSLLLSVALTSFITGITEPIEFTFLFLAPVLFAVHAVLAGVAFATCHVLEICIGTTFSDGLIDFILYGVLPGQAKSNWMMMVPVIAVYFVLYFVVFRYFILKLNLKTPGREDDDEEVHMYTKADFQKTTGVGVAKSGISEEPLDMKSATIVKGVGGLQNLEDIDCCATRLRLTVKDSAAVNQDLLKSTGASAVVMKGNGIQVIYGPQVTIVKSNLEEFVEKVREGSILESDFMEVASTEMEEKKPEIQESSGTEIILGAHMNGTALPLSEVKDEAFASNALGEGVAIEPTEGKLYAPVDAEITMVFDTKHALGLKTAQGVEILLHIGIDTVKLNGEHFETHVQVGDQVKKGELLVTFDDKAIVDAGYLLTTPMVIANTYEYQSIEAIGIGEIRLSEDILKIKG
ncbi:MAG: PTS transporter subunit EIIC [Eubacteriaceae bacterium]|nr:PTS transporter subunit EIIC [Eubacteriaceae bacterium]